MYDERCQKKQKNYTQWFLILAKLIAWPSLLLLFRIKRYYAADAKKGTPKGGCVIVCNHGSVMEPLMFVTNYLARRVHFLVNKTVLDVSPLLKWLLLHLCCVPVDKTRMDAKSVMELSRRARSGELTVMFPEGRIAPVGETLPFASGAVTLALAAGVSIIPVYANVHDSLWKRRRLVFGAPISPEQLCPGVPTLKKIDAAAEMLRREVMRLGDHLYVKTGGKHGQKALL